jgi:hypothetical protein
LKLPNRLEIFPSNSSKALLYEATIESIGGADKIKIKLRNFDYKVDGHLCWVLTEYK